MLETKNNNKLWAPDVLPEFAFSSYTFLYKKNIIIYTYTTFGGLLQNNGFYDKSIFIDNRDDDNNNNNAYIVVLSLFLSIINIIYHMYIM